MIFLKEIFLGINIKISVAFLLKILIPKQISSNDKKSLK